ncbi:LysR family transcriptional regulator [Bosea sp. NPDC055332]
METRLTLDPEAVETFVLVAEHRSFTRAAGLLNTTQAAASLRLRRLEERLGQRLLERTPRRVTLTSAGERFLAPAREFLAAHRRATDALSSDSVRLSVGITHHLVGPDLARLLQAAGKRDGGVTLNLRISSTRALLQRYDAGDLDAVIALRYDESRRDGELLTDAQFGWFSAPDVPIARDEPLPLAAQPEPCKLRLMAVEALEAAGIPWREAFTGEGAAAVGAAAIAGLGVALLARQAAPTGLSEIGAHLALPAVPTRPIVLHSSVSQPRAAATLTAIAAAFRS